MTQNDNNCNLTLSLSAHVIFFLVFLFVCVFIKMLIRRNARYELQIQRKNGNISEKRFVLLSWMGWRTQIFCELPDLRSLQPVEAYHI